MPNRPDRPRILTPREHKCPECDELCTCMRGNHWGEQNCECDCTDQLHTDPGYEGHHDNPYTE